MLTAVACLGHVGVGITAPYFMQADDGHVYVVKLKNNRLGAQVLASEFLAARLGERLALCFPPSGLIKIPEAALPPETAADSAAIFKSCHFASRYVEQCAYANKKNIAAAINLPQVAGVMLFDHLFHNADRTNNRKNLLLKDTPAGPRVYAIDHSHLFGSGRWSIDSLERLAKRIKIYDRYLYRDLLRLYLRGGDFRPHIEQIKALDDAYIKALVAQIPPDWLPDEAARPALIRFICRRRRLIDDIWQCLEDRLPLARRD